MTDQAMSPLRRRMIEDMTIRKLAAKTDYIQRVKDFAVFWAAHRPLPARKTCVVCSCIYRRAAPFIFGLN